ncbi:ATP-dependent DNA helicase PIF1-like [Chenopodium quinoa]|uniref:ATP-dependent DNA helicase PIF1-like n=1 Tax=Chenopodium quinoa TaxID=63459 RepID=UPI000B796815|nr:ATP-dependent DNA helicase PIF1-like [Chenopodium quinoa]
MSEAEETHMPMALRRLFATILIFCQPKDPYSLWCKYFTSLSEDFQHQYQDNVLKVKQLTIRSLEQYLEAMGKSLKIVGLPKLCFGEEDDFQRMKDIIDALDAPIPQSCIDCIDHLNSEQLVAFSQIMQYVQLGKSGAFFIDGPGGTGKTFLYNALYAKIKLMNKIVLPTATSGIAAANIPSGRSAHSRFKIPIDIEASLACDVPKQGSLAALLKETTLIIWDEASMANKSNLESLDLLLQDICSNNKLFGGKLVVLGGDFRQVLPVVPLKNQKEIVQSSIVTSYIWPRLIKFQLTQNQRAKDDPEFSSFLLALGNGQLQQSENAYVQLPANISKPFAANVDPVSEVFTSVFPEFYKGDFDETWFTERAILTHLNDIVDSINSSLIQQFPGNVVIYKSFDTILSDTCDVYPTEFLNKLCPGGLSPHELVLKKNCPVILLRNLLPSAGLCNGTRLICKNFFSNTVQCVIAVGQYKGTEVFIPRINLRPSASVRYPFQFERKQFPLKLSFSMTINKSQGQTLNRVSVYLPRPCFSHGQLYVALSRARKQTDVTVFSTMPPEEFPSTSVKNVVCYEVLRLVEIC